MSGDMKKFVIKILSVLILVGGIIVGTNYYVDPANIYHDKITKEMVKLLQAGHIVRSPENLDEGLRLKLMVEGMQNAPDIVILGSSHTRYIPFEYNNYYNASLSSATLGDIYAAIGIFKYNALLPKKVIIGVDPYIFLNTTEVIDHSTIKNYSEYMKKIVSIGGETAELSETASDSIRTKLKELYNVAYFQSSIKHLLYGDIKTKRTDAQLKIEKDDRISNFPKQMPNGRGIPNSALQMTSQECILRAEEAIRGMATSFLIKTDVLSENKEAVQEFESLLEYLSREGVEVEFYLPTYPPTFYEYCEKDNNYQGVMEIENYLLELAKENNICVRGTFNPDIVSVTNESLFDYQHLSTEEMLRTYNFIQENR